MGVCFRKENDLLTYDSENAVICLPTLQKEQGSVDIWFRKYNDLLAYASERAMICWRMLQKR